MHRHPSHRPGNGIVVYATVRQTKPSQTKHGNGAPGGARVVAAPRGRMLPPARAPGAARATEDFLAETVCFGRAAPPGAPPRSAAPAVDRRKLEDRTRSAGSLSASGGGMRRLKRRSMASVKRKPNYASDFCKPLARACFFGAPHQNDGGRRCQAAPNGVHPRIILRRRVECELSAGEIRKVFRTRPHRRPKVRFGG